MRKNTLWIGNHALLTRISKQLPYPCPIRLICPSLFFLWRNLQFSKFLCYVIILEKGLDYSCYKHQEFTYYCLHCHLNVTHMWVKKKKNTTKPRAINLAAHCLSESFRHNLLSPFLFTDLMIWFKIWKVHRTYCFVPELEADSPSIPPSYLPCCQWLLSSAFSGHHLDYLLGKHKEKRNQCPLQFGNSTECK